MTAGPEAGDPATATSTLKHIGLRIEEDATIATRTPGAAPLAGSAATTIATR